MTAEKVLIDSPHMVVTWYCVAHVLHFIQIMLVKLQIIILTLSIIVATEHFHVG